LKELNLSDLNKFCSHLILSVKPRNPKERKLEPRIDKLLLTSKTPNKLTFHMFVLDTLLNLLVLLLKVLINDIQLPYSLLLNGFIVLIFIDERKASAFVTLRKAKMSVKKAGDAVKKANAKEKEVGGNAANAEK
jgi:hypothetical protein